MLTARRSWMAFLIAALVGLTSAQAAQAAPGSGSPDAAVRRFTAGFNQLSGASKSSDVVSTFDALCRRTISPDVREAFEFPVGIDDETTCGLALIVLTSTSTGSDDPTPASETATVTATRRLGRNQAVVQVRLTDRDAHGRTIARHRVAFLASRVGGRWWVATPEQLGHRSATSVTRLRRTYATYRRRATANRRARQAALLAARPFAPAVPCPAAGLAQLADPVADVTDQGGQKTTQQPSSSDLVAVRSSPDGASICVEVELAGAPPASGALALSVPPSKTGVVVSWGKDGAVGQVGTDSPRAFGIAPTRGERTLSFRIPAAELGSPAPGATPAARLFTDGPGSESGYLDAAPEEPTDDRGSLESATR